ncbi:MAG: DUF4004 family protein [Cellulosilyticaceae bacterium]
MLISKKELLKETGISYGQLYRWKREGLIPEDWFIKQPSFTGQETFFPKSKILSRIRAIQELKDKYSLEEIAKMLSPEVGERYFTTDDLLIIEEIENHLVPAFVQGFQKDSFSYIEILIMIALSSLQKEVEIERGQISDLIEGVKGYCEKIKTTGYIFVLFDCSSDYYATLYGEQAEVFFDGRFSIVKEIRLDDLSNQIKMKYRKSFNLKFQEEKEMTTGMENMGYSY